jgi:hypothetical protein
VVPRPVRPARGGVPPGEGGRDDESVVEDENEPADITQLAVTEAAAKAELLESSI